MTTETTIPRRRSTDAEYDAHKKITERHGQEISMLRTDVAGLKTGLQNVDATLNKIGDKIDVITQPHPTNWTGVGSLIVAIILFLGGVFSFFFKAQNDSVTDALTYSSKESQLRHEIQESQITRLDAFASHIYKRFIEENEAQEKMNMDFVKDAR